MRQEEHDDHRGQQGGVQRGGQRGEKMIARFVFMLRGWVLAALDGGSSRGVAGSCRRSVPAVRVRGEVGAFGPRVDLFSG